MEMEIADTKVTITDKPTHSATVYANNLMEHWLLKNIDITKYDKDDKLTEVLTQEVLDDPELAMQVLMLENSLDDEQTIILMTGMPPWKWDDLKDRMYEDEYQDLLGKCKKALGGTASDFFGRYGISSTLETTRKVPNTKQSGSKTSGNQRESSSKK